MSRLALIVCLVPLSFAANAMTVKPDNAILKSVQVRAMIDEIFSNKVLTVMVKAQSARHRDLTQQEIIALDKTWRSERKSRRKPLISATLSNPLSSFLTRMQARSAGIILESFVMDSKGLNVGQSSMTSDYWQGDEAKFQKTYDVGKGAVFIDEAEWDDSRKLWKAQISQTLLDDESKEVIGAFTVEFNLTELERRIALQAELL